MVSSKKIKNCAKNQGITCQPPADSEATHRLHTLGEGGLLLVLGWRGKAVVVVVRRHLVWYSPILQNMVKPGAQRQAYFNLALLQLVR